VNHTRFPQEDHLRYWASGQQRFEAWSCRISTTKHFIWRHSDQSGHKVRLSTLILCRS